MSQTRHTSLSLRTQFTALVASLASCDPADYFATSRLLEQLGAMRTQMERDNAEELLPICSLAIGLMEILNKEGQLGARETMSAIDGVMRLMCGPLGIEQPATHADLQPKAPDSTPKTSLPSPKEGSPSLKLLSHKKLGEMLVQMSLLTPSQVEQALSHQRLTGCRLGEALIQMRILARETVESALRMQGARRANEDPWVVL
jgi:hypothetical protein